MMSPAVLSRLDAVRPRPTWWPSRPSQALGGVGEPRAPADVAIAARIAVGEQVEPGARLVGEVGGDRIGVLLAEGDIGHRHRERAALQVLHEPVRTRQRAGDGGQQRVVFRDGQHGALRSGAGQRPFVALFSLAAGRRQCGTPVSLAGPTVPVAGAQDVPREVGSIEPAARELRIGKPAELLVHGRRIVVVGAGPEPGGGARPQAPVQAVPGRCTPDDHGT